MPDLEIETFVYKNAKKSKMFIINIKIKIQKRSSICK